MYVITFYSFKGGTGRSMALANVAADLLARGRRVLLVDFDLEAPGLDTFVEVDDRHLARGLVEMISDYLTTTTGDIPNADQYIYEAKFAGMETGKLWIMPAGLQDTTYDSRFKSIDWLDFYENQEGFLFFEDLKIQWNQTLAPDYVLIDSRTGHTDIGGICTRQLPDAVVAVFFPNEQNLRGLSPVVQDIKAEEHTSLKKRIELHFVMANVPDLDDEDAILLHACLQAEELLEYSSLAATIHHFNSLSMLEQKIMVIDRPRSKIAAEYRELNLAIMLQNLEDRDGALSVLENALSDLRFDDETGVGPQLEEKLQKVRALHPEDIEILKHLAKFRRAQRRTEEALETFDQILQRDATDTESLVGRAEVLTITRKTDAAIQDLTSFFKLQHVSPFSFSMAVRLLLANDPDNLSPIVNSPAAIFLPSGAIIDIVTDLQRSYSSSEFAIALIRKWYAANEGSVEAARILVYELALCLIAMGQFVEAKQELERNQDLTSPNLAVNFNYAMAEWGRSREAPASLFQELLPLIDEVQEPIGLNQLQCFSLAYWAAGDKDGALKYFERTLSQFNTAPRSVFSAWSYLYRSPKDFRADLEAMELMLNGDIGRPAFIRDDLFSAVSGLLQ